VPAANHPRMLAARGERRGPWLVASSHARTAIGSIPHRRARLQRSTAALAGGAVGIGLGRVAETAVAVATGVLRHICGLRGIDQVVRGTGPVDLGQRPGLTAQMPLMPREPLILIPASPPDPADLLESL
jgi:hypothetical protein